MKFFVKNCFPQGALVFFKKGDKHLMGNVIEFHKDAIYLKAREMGIKNLDAPLWTYRIGIDEADGILEICHDGKWIVGDYTESIYDKKSLKAGDVILYKWQGNQETGKVIAVQSSYINVEVYDAAVGQAFKVTLYWNDFELLYVWRKQDD